jgi:hypothetical protein
MAKRGPKVTPKPLNLVKGGKKSDAPPPPDFQTRDAKLIPPKALDAMQQKIWDDYIDGPAWWLQQNDALLAFIFVNLMAEFMESPEGMVAARIGELRKTMAELHLTSSERARIGIPTAAQDPADKYFDD